MSYSIPFSSSQSMRWRSALNWCGDPLPRSRNGMSYLGRMFTIGRIQDE